MESMDDNPPLTMLADNDTIQNITNLDNEYKSGRDENLAKVEIATLSFILMVAIVGNGLMLIALRRQLQYRPMSRMYFFMLNLSIADLFVAFCNILPQLAWDITFRFLGSDLLCRVVKFLQVFVLYLSTYVLTSMALDRYLVVCHHSFSRNYYGALKGPKLLVIASYVLSFILASPQAFIFSIQEVEAVPGQITEDCWVTFIEPWGAKAYVTFFVMCAFVFPLLVIGLSYGAICYKVIRFKVPHTSKPKEIKRRSSLSTSSDNRNRSETESHWHSGLEEAPLQKVAVPTCSTVGTKNQIPGERNALQRHISQAKIKTLKLTLAVVICFFVCWAPFCITQIVMAYTPHNAGPIQVIFLLLASLNSCTNPWIYLAFSESLCNQLRVCLGFGLKRGSDEESIGDEVNEPDKKPANGNAMANRGGKEVVNKAVLTSIGRNAVQEEQKPETKSDFL